MGVRGGVGEGGGGRGSRLLTSIALDSNIIAP